MKLLTLFLFILLSLNDLYSQTGWTVQTSGTTDALFDSYFFDQNTGIIVGGTATNTAVLLRTTNGGTNWNSLTLNTTVLLRGIDFITSSTGIVAGGNAVFAVILRTTDGGLSWDTIPSPTASALRSVSFPPTGTGNIGYIAGFNGTVLKTNNAGLNWTMQNSGIETLMLYAIHFTDALTGTAVGGSQADTAVIIRTTDGGISWIRQIPNTVNLLRGVYFINSSTGFAVGNRGTILKTVDGGNNWIVVQTSIPNLFLRDIYFSDANTGFIVGSGGRIYKTTNGGDNFDTIPSGINKDLQSVFFLNNLFGTSVGFDGTIIHTNTGGVITSINSSGNIINENYSLSQNYPNPFNPKTIINYQISMFNSVQIKIYNVLGDDVTTLIDQKQSPGNYSVDWDASGNPSGIYFYELYINGKPVDSKRMVLLK